MKLARSWGAIKGVRVWSLLLSLRLTGAAQAQTEPKPGTSMEACRGCHAASAGAGVADGANTKDVHYIDQDPGGPGFLTPPERQ